MQRLRHRRTNVTATIPAGPYEPGELAINLIDGALYYGDSAGTPTPLFLPVGADPTVTIGLTPVNGTSRNFLRADSAPALNQNILPVWTNLHTFNAGINVNGPSTFTGPVTFTNTATFSGPLVFAVDLWHRSSDNAQRFYFQNNERTTFGAPNGRFDWVNAAGSVGMVLNAANLSVGGNVNLGRYLSGGPSSFIALDLNDNYLRLNPTSQFTNGVYTPGALRADGGLRSNSLTWITDTSLSLNFNAGSFTYGTAYLSGAVSGFTGLTLADGSKNATFMSNGTTFGVYRQGGTAGWSWYDDGSYFNTTLQVSAPGFRSPSARALKHIIAPLSGVSALLDQLCPVIYRLLSGGEEEIGLIAEDVQKACPWLSDGASVRYDRLAVLLLAERQERRHA